MLTPEQLAVVRHVNAHRRAPKCCGCIHSVDSRYGCTLCGLDDEWRDSFRDRSACPNWKTTIPLLSEE